MRTICTLLLAVMFSAAATAQTYAALSLVGHEMSIIHAGHSTGSNRDTNIHEAMPMTDRALDRAALRAVDQAMRKARPDAKVVLLSASDPAWTAAARQDLSSGSPDFAALASGLGKAAGTVGADRVIVVLPARGDLLLRIQQGSLGRGRATGIGFYLDRHTRLSRADNREAADGFLGVFANFRVVLIEAPGGRVLAEDAVSSGVAFSNARATGSDPMTVLTGEQKVQVIDGLLRNEIARVLPTLLTKAG